MKWMAILLACLILISPGVTAKHKTNLYTPEEIRIAKERIKKELWAKEEYDKIMRDANKWASYSDAFLRDLVTSAGVPRAFDVNFNQCPIHSEEIKKYGSYPWILDINKPWKVKCPVGGEYYPTNDFDPENVGGPDDVVSDEYVDTGWGWKKEGEDEKYWFIAYYNIWSMRKFTIPAIESLSKAYLLTGDTKYSHKATILLYRIAQEYPEMNYVEQSRYGTEIQKGTYHGRMYSRIQECGLVETLARAYDAIYEGIGGDKELEDFLGKSADEIKAKIETDLLEDAARSIYTMDGRILGNYGMHQSALATIAVVLDNENSDKYIDWVLFESGEDSSYLYQGIASGLYNLLYQDGVGLESAPGYNFLWLETFTNVAEVLLKRGINMYEEYPKMKDMLDIPIAWVMNDTFTPNIGDSGSIISKGRVGWVASQYQIAFRRYNDPRYAKILNTIGAVYGRDLFKESIKYKVEDAIKIHGKALYYGSDNLSGYGLALLRGGPPGDPLSVSLYYGRGGGHDHYARLNIEVFGKGVRLVPDLGYPEFMSGYHKKLCGWTGHTVSHVTVMVDEKRQFNKEAGTLHHFYSLPGIQYADVSAENAYKGVVDTYRRSLALLDTPDGKNAYIVDLFRVKGGPKHHYSIHGPVGDFSVDGISLSPQREGTLAGQDVPFGTLYDDPSLERPGFKGPYDKYQGSGFGYLFNVQEGEPRGVWSANWDLKDGKKTGLRMTFLGDDHGIVVAEGEPPRKGDIPNRLKYILRERKGPKLESLFITIIEPYKEKSFIQDAQILGVDKTAVALKIQYPNGTDYIIQDPHGKRLITFDEGLSSQGSLARVSTDGDGIISISLGPGQRIEKDGLGVVIERGYGGEVEAIDCHNRRIRVQLDDSSAPLPTCGALKGKSLFFSNQYRSTEYEIGEVTHLENNRYEIELKGSDFICGYGRCTQRQDFRSNLVSITADRNMVKKEYYRGMYLVKKGADRGGLITMAESDGKSFLIRAQGALDLTEGDEFHIHDFGIGSKFIIDTGISIKLETQEKKALFSRKPGARWSVETTSSFTFTLPPGKGLEYMDQKGGWIRAISRDGGRTYHLDISNFPGGRGYLRIVDS